MSKDQFLSRVDARGACHLWRGSINRGYGVLSHGGRRVRAHRFAAHLFHGFDLGSSLHVCHSCDNPICVNPDHLFVGTPADNMADKVAKRRQSVGISRNGIRANASAKLTLAQVRSARKRLSRGEGQRPIARDFGVSRQVIQKLAQGRTWREVV